VFGLGKCTVFGAVYGIGSPLEDDPIFAHTPPAAAAQQIENAPGHQLADYRLNVTASDIRLIRDPVSANPRRSSSR
jgi:hypothetical protein